jgi:hypothetical protein
MPQAWSLSLEILELRLNSSVQHAYYDAASTALLQRGQIARRAYKTLN